MAESWFSLSSEDQAEALEFAASRTGRPAHLLEKDIWLVWVLSAIYNSELANKLTFKGGTSRISSVIFCPVRNSCLRSDCIPVDPTP